MPALIQRKYDRVGETLNIFKVGDQNSLLMNMRLNLSKSTVVLAVALATSSFALADIPGSSGATTLSPSSGGDPAYNFTFDVGGNTGFGSVFGAGADPYLAVSGTITVVTSNDTADIGTYSLLPGGPSGFLSPSGAFIADNVFSPSADPTLDVYGLLFGGGGLEINLWGNGAGNYSFSSFNGAGYNVAATDSGSVVFAAAPEPSGILLLSIMLFGVGVTFRMALSRS